MNSEFMITDTEDLVRIISVAGGLTLGAMFIAFLLFCVWLGARRKVRQTAEFEQSRREIAAYVAEGSIAPEDAARLLAPRRTLGARIADSV